jgi:hypothetical protein
MNDSSAPATEATDAEKQSSLDTTSASSIPDSSASNGESVDVTAIYISSISPGRLDHPNIIFSPERNGSSAKLARTRPWSEALAEEGARLDRVERQLPIFLQVCSAMAFAHARGVVHRDLRPATIRVGEFGEVFIAGWERALDLNASEPARRAASPEGTPAYMAPEQVSLDVSGITPRTDVFLLGGILRELLTGAPPRSGESDQAIVEQIATQGGQIASPKAAVAKKRLSPEYAEICEKAMAVDPAERFASAAELRDRVAECALGVSRKRQAKTILKENREDLTLVDDYAKLNEIESLASRALSLWPENGDFARWRFRIRRRKAELAIERRDFALGGTILDIMRGGDGDAFVIDALRASLEEGVAQKRASRRRRNILMWVGYAAFTLVLVCLLVLSGAQMGMVDRAQQGRRDALKERNRAWGVLTSLLREIDAQAAQGGIEPAAIRSLLDVSSRQTERLWSESSRSAPATDQGEFAQGRAAEIYDALAEGYRVLGDFRRAADMLQRSLETRETLKATCQGLEKLRAETRLAEALLLAGNPDQAAQASLRAASLAMACAKPVASAELDLLESVLKRLEEITDSDAAHRASRLEAWTKLAETRAKMEPNNAERRAAVWQARRRWAEALEARGGEKALHHALQIAQSVFEEVAEAPQVSEDAASDANALRELAARAEKLLGTSSKERSATPAGSSTPSAEKPAPSSKDGEKPAFAELEQAAPAPEPEKLASSLDAPEPAPATASTPAAAPNSSGAQPE